VQLRLAGPAPLPVERATSASRAFRLPARPPGNGGNRRFLRCFPHLRHLPKTATIGHHSPPRPLATLRYLAPPRAGLFFRPRACGWLQYVTQKAWKDCGSHGRFRQLGKV